MKKLLWFGDVGRPTSFSRITENVLPQLENLDCYLLAPPKNLSHSIPILPPNKIYHVGDSFPTDRGIMDWKMFQNMHGSQGENMLTLNMKYSLVQALSICTMENIDYLMFVIGIYECDWFMGLIKLVQESIGALNTKIIVWTPIDYIPTKPVIENLLKADYIFTMTEEMSTYLPNSRVIGHGVSDCFFPIKRKKAIQQFRKKHKMSKILATDIIILNANNFVPRKQFSLTLEAFCKIAKDNVNLKLWLHTSIHNSDFKELLNMYTKKHRWLEQRIILSENKLSSKELNLIYNICQYGLQTSNGEGWSLTNCEHAKVGGVQIVPDFLATGVHFKEIGFTFPTEKIKTVNEAGKEVYVGKYNVDDISKAIKKAMGLKNKKEYTESINKYLSSYTWEKISKNIEQCLCTNTKV